MAAVAKKVPVFDSSHAFCGDCELGSQCEAGKWVTCEVGVKYRAGGMMIVGEGPGREEVSRKVPFVGQAGRLLDRLLESADIDRSACVVTNATLCLPPARHGEEDKKSLHERFPNAIFSCLPRLQAEIAHFKPRVILALGVPALVALTGSETTREVQREFKCDNPRCRTAVGKQRYVFPAIACATATCDWLALAPAELEKLPDGQQAPSDSVAIKAWHQELLETTKGVCPKCGSRISRLKPKAVRCPSCKGSKKRIEYVTTFEAPRTAMIGRNGIAGAVYDHRELPSWLIELGVKYVIPTYHPSFCLRAFRGGSSSSASYQIGGQFAARASTVHMDKARELLTRDAHFVAKPFISDDPDVVARWLFSSNRPTAVDVESSSREGPWRIKHLTCIGFGRADREDALVVPSWAFSEWWKLKPDSKQARLMDVLQGFLEDPSYPKVFQNGIFDITAIRRLCGIIVQGTVSDILIAHTNCYPDEEHNLGFMAHELTDAPPWKDNRKAVPADVEHEFSGYATFHDLADYNAKDTRATAVIDEVLRGADGQHGLVAVDGSPDAFAVDMEMFRIACEMQWAGLPFCTETRNKLRVEYEQKAAEAHKRMYDVCGARWLEYAAANLKHRKVEEWAPSGNALIWALYDENGPNGLVPPAYSEKTSKPTLSKDHLLKLRHIPFVADLLAYNKNTYYLSHYFDSPDLVPWDDGRIHPEWKPWGARSGRWSSSPNFQNWPRILRQLIKARPGRRITGADAAQVEFRIMATLARCQKLMDLCANADNARKLEPDHDPHSFMAFHTYGETYTRLDVNDKAQKTQRALLRDIVKRVVYGLGYGGGADTVHAAIYAGGYEGPPITINDVQRVIQIFFTVFPEIATWREEKMRLANETLSVESAILHRHRIFPLGQIDFTIVANYDVQATASDIMNLQLIELAKVLPNVDPTAQFIAQVHDAIYVEHDETKEADVQHCMRETLSSEWQLTPGGAYMPFPFDVHSSDNWFEAS